MIFSLVVLVIVVIVSGTYAYYVWTTSDSDTTKIVAGIGAATVTFDGGSDISANLRPVSDKSKGIVKNINVKADTTGLVFNMYLDITSIDTGLKDESFRYELYKGTTKVKEGNFSDSYLTSNTVTCTKNNTNHIVLLTNESISMSKTSYTLYIWIDGENYTNPNTMMNKTFSFKLHADGEGAVLKPPPTAADTITELYKNAEKATVTNNSIDYHIAPTVSRHWLSCGMSACLLPLSCSSPFSARLLLSERWRRGGAACAHPCGEPPTRHSPCRMCPATTSSCRCTNRQADHWLRCSSCPRAFLTARF